MDDTISRQDAIDALDEQITLCDKALGSFDISMEYEYAVKVERASLEAYRETLTVLPSAQPERKKGKWIYKNFVWFCSECDNSPTKGMGYVQGHDELYDFCPHCGADMRERKEE